MRWLPFMCGSLVAGLAYSAGAYDWNAPWERLLSMKGTVSSAGRSALVTELPVDAVPWESEVCEEQLSDECVFISDGPDVASIPATVTTTGKAACTMGDGSTFGMLYFIRSFVPDEPFEPGQQYRLECGDFFNPGWVRARRDTAPSAPPGALKITDRKIRQGDPGCNGPGDYLDVRIEGIAGPYLDEGGYIELLGPQGEAFAFVYGGGPWISLPLVEGTFHLTPVAADGTRGETVAVDAEGADKEAVYLSCAADPRGNSFVVWLLAPLVWVGMQARRRRRRRWR